MHIVERIGVLLLAAALAYGCGGDDDGGGSTPDSGARDAGVPPDGGPGDAGGLDAGSPRDGGTAMTPDGGGTPDGGTGPRAVRFAVMGDTGEGNTTQRDVAIAIRDTCAAEGCDFVMLLGDNFYDSGVDSVDDPQWSTKFEEPYRDIDLPFYAVLGNHDYGGELFGSDRGGLGNEFEKGAIEVAYTAESMKWTMPDTHYTFQIGSVGFLMLDTNSILWDNTDNGDQRAWVSGAIADLRADGAEWIVAAGHHPYRSNGVHGNAGAYESIEIGGIEIPNPIPILNGGNVLSFFDTYLCGEVDIYFAGHDHNRQWLDEPTALCGAELIVSGAGAKFKEFGSSLNSLQFGNETSAGFLYAVIDGDRFYGRFVRRDGTVEFEREVARRTP